MTHTLHLPIRTAGTATPSLPPTRPDAPLPTKR